VAGRHDLAAKHETPDLARIPIAPEHPNLCATPS
jgi:hypothetical protein